MCAVVMQVCRNISGESRDMLEYVTVVQKAKEKYFAKNDMFVYDI